MFNDDEHCHNFTWEHDGGCGSLLGKEDVTCSTYNADGAACVNAYLTRADGSYSHCVHSPDDPERYKPNDNPPYDALPREPGAAPVHDPTSYLSRTFVLSIDRPVDQLRLPLFEDLILDGAPTSLVNADPWTSNGVLTLVNPDWQAGVGAAGTPLLRITTVDEVGADTVADAVNYGMTSSPSRHRRRVAAGAVSPRRLHLPAAAAAAARRTAAAAGRCGSPAGAVEQGMTNLLCHVPSAAVGLPHLGPGRR